MATRKAGRRSRREPGGGASESRRALLVAINDYGSPQNNLPSCLEDAAQFRSVLQSRYGFETFTELYDGDATVANVESGLAWLFENAADDHRSSSSTPATATSSPGTAISKSAWS
jgi:hypothetical protein